MALAGNPKHFKVPKEERERQEKLRSRFLPGMTLVFKKADYHEDDKTPRGFHEVGDRCKLLSVVKTKPIVSLRGFGPWKKQVEVGRCNVWLVDDEHWGEQQEQSEFYLSWMCEEVER